MINCSLGNDGVLSYEDTCTTMCNTGYEIQAGDAMRFCQSDGVFNGTSATCDRGGYPGNSSLKNVIIIVALTRWVVHG